MRCTEVRGYLSDYLEGALSADQRQQIEAHLQTCLACAQERLVLERVPALVRQWSPSVPSEPIWAGIEAYIQAGGERRVARPLTPSPLSKGGRGDHDHSPFAIRRPLMAIFAAAAVVALIAFFLWNRPAPTYPPLNGSYTNYWQAHREWAQSGGAGELYPYVEAQ